MNTVDDHKSLNNFFHVDSTEISITTELTSEPWICRSGKKLASGPAVCLGDGPTENYEIPSQGGRGDAPLWRMPQYLNSPDITSFSSGMGKWISSVRPSRFHRLTFSRHQCFSTFSRTFTCRPEQKMISPLTYINKSRK